MSIWPILDLKGGGLLKWAFLALRPRGGQKPFCLSEAGEDDMAQVVHPAFPHSIWQQQTCPLN
jgi:hypothetical protein